MTPTEQSGRLARQATYPGSELFLLDRFMLERGFRPAQWLLGTGLHQEAIEAPDTLITLEQLDVIYRNIYRLCAEPDIGLTLGRALNLSRWGPFALAMICADSLRDALAIANRYRKLIHSRFDLTPRARGDVIQIGLTRSDSEAFPVDERFAVEMLLGTLQSMISDLLAEAVTFARIRLRYPAPRYADRYRRYFGCAVDFDCAASELEIAAEVMNRPLRLANPSTRRQAEQLCEQEYQRQQRVKGSDFRWLVQHALAVHEGEPPALEEVARGLAVSPRTLRRKLQESGTSFREILQAHQLQRALQALAQDDKPIKTIAVECGYADSASFGEAFKRWTGMTAKAYRAQFLKSG